jgi:putative spermidine/putrescine transport system ATP-binding protein
MVGGVRVAQLSARAGNLSDLSLEIPAGALLAVLGDADSGASALLSVLAGTAPARSGDMSLDGAAFGRLPPNRRGFGVVRRADALFPNLSLAENVAYPLRLRGVRGAERKRLVEAALDSVLLREATRRPHLASAAERQRAAIARATIFGPRLLLLDEPLSEQPAETRPAMLAALRRLHLLLGTTTILATRVPDEALALADQVAVLHRGRLEQFAPPATLYDQPVSAVAAAATGEINLLPGHIAAIDPDGTANIRLECGPTVAATPPAGLKLRDRCLFALRPERIAVAPMRAADMGDDALDATLLEVLHLGALIRLRLLLGSGAELVVKRPAAAGTRGLGPGQTVAVAWQAGHAAVFGAVG